MFAGYGHVIIRVIIAFVGTVSSLVLLLLSNQLGTGMSGQIFGFVIMFGSGGYMTYKWIYNLYVRQRKYKGTIVNHSWRGPGDSEDRTCFIGHTEPLQGDGEINEFLPGVAARTRHKDYMKIVVEWIQDNLVRTEETLAKERETTNPGHVKLSEPERQKVEQFKLAFGDRVVGRQLDLDTLKRDWPTIRKMLSEDLDDVVALYYTKYYATEVFLYDPEPLRKVFISIAPFGEGSLYHLFQDQELLLGGWPSKDKTGQLWTIEIGAHDRSRYIPPSKMEGFLRKIRVLPQADWVEIKERVPTELVIGSDANAMFAKANMKGILRLVAPAPRMSKEDQQIIGEIITTRDAAPYEQENIILRERNNILEEKVTDNAIWGEGISPVGTGMPTRWPKVPWKLILGISIPIIAIALLIYVMNRVGWI